MYQAAHKGVAQSPGRPLRVETHEQIPYERHSRGNRLVAAHACPSRHGRQAEENPMLDGVMLLWFLLATASLLFVAIDIRTTPESPVMKWGFVLLTAYTRRGRRRPLRPRLPRAPARAARAILRGAVAADAGIDHALRGR